LGRKAVYPLWCPSLTKDMQTEQLLCWSGMTDTEHTTSGSNEENVNRQLLFFQFAKHGDEGRYLLYFGFLQFIPYTLV